MQNMQFNLLYNKVKFDLIIYQNSQPMQQLDNEGTWQQLNYEQFYDRFQQCVRTSDIYNRSYNLCIDRMTNKTVIVRQYPQQDYKLLDLLQDVQNFVKLSSETGICKLLCYARGKGKFNMAFDYSQFTLQQYLKDGTKVLSKSYQFIIALFVDVVTSFIFLLYQNNYEYDDIRRESIIIEEHSEVDIVIKIYLDQRAKYYENLDIAAPIHNVYYSPEKLELIKNPEISYQFEKICVYEIGLLILDVATDEIGESLYIVKGSGETGLPYLEMNYDVIDRKLQLINQKFEDKSILSAIKMALGVYEERPSLLVWYNQNVDKLPPEMNTSLRMTMREHMSNIKGKSMIKETEEELEPIPLNSVQSAEQHMNILMNQGLQIQRLQSQNEGQKIVNIGQVTETHIETNVQTHTQTHAEAHTQFQALTHSSAHNTSTHHQVDNLNSILILKELVEKLNIRQQIKIRCLTYIDSLESLSEIVFQKYDGCSMYYGQMIDNNKQGKGIFVYRNGAIFYGSWNNNKKHDGTCIYHNNQTYSGTFKGGKNGQGEYYYSNGDVYQGEWESDLKNGRGRFTFKNGDVYQGEWVHDKKHGVGKFTNANGVVYQGCYVNGHKKGECQISFPDGRVLKGDWDKIKQGTEGRFEYKNGDVYEGFCRSPNNINQGVLKKENGTFEGTFVNGVLNGACNITYNNGEKYVGEVCNGIKQGEGMYTYCNGDQFKGEWVNNCKSRGVYTYSIGNVFTGSFVDNEIANGVMEYSSGDRYEGDFVDGLREGFGKYTSVGNQVVEGRWRKDILIQKGHD